ncbi:TPA: NAD-dependent epimerase/dehydratase family protein [Enterococcus faecium]|nr:NAD-dependent epimerase/dehydratase family protein [Streptococcus agalactiae]
MEKIIGILGGSGQIGKRCIDILKQKNYSILATYNQNYVPDDKNCRYMKLEVSDIDALREFIKKCDIILNCAGASFINGENIARIASDFGVPYIDPSGESFLEDRLEDIKNKNLFILSAGYFPGLTGLMLKYVAEHFEVPLMIEGFNISNEVPSYSAIEDFILTNLSGFGKSLSSYIDGEVINNNCYKTEEYKNKKYKMYNYLTNEILRVAKKYNLKQANWYNCSFSSEILIKMQMIVQKMQQNIYIDNKKDIDEILNYFKKEVGIGKTYSYLNICGRGRINGRTSSVEISIDSSSSSEMSAIVLGYTAMSILENTFKNGIYYAMDIIKIDRIIQDIDSLNINYSINEKFEGENYYESEL